MISMSWQPVSHSLAVCGSKVRPLAYTLTHSHSYSPFPSSLSFANFLTTNLQNLCLWQDVGCEWKLFKFCVHTVQSTVSIQYFIHSTVSILYRVLYPYSSEYCIHTVQSTLSVQFRVLHPYSTEYCIYTVLYSQYCMHIVSTQWAVSETSLRTHGVWIVSTLQPSAIHGTHFAFFFHKVVLHQFSFQIGIKKPLSEKWQRLKKEWRRRRQMTTFCRAQKRI